MRCFSSSVLSPAHAVFARQRSLDMFANRIVSDSSMKIAPLYLINGSQYYGKSTFSIELARKDHEKTLRIDLKAASGKDTIAKVVKKSFDKFNEKALLTDRDETITKTTTTTIVTGRTRMT